MSEIATDEQLRQLIQEQGESLLNYVALIAAGQTDIELDIPEGIEVMSDLAVALQYLAEDVGERIESQNRLLNELEVRVEERTQELAQTLENLKRSQQQFVREEWNKYLKSQSENLDNPDWMQDGHFEPIVQQAMEQRIPALNASNHKQGSALTLPINYADELIGLLGFEGDDLDNLTDEDLAALEDIAEQVGLALENQRLFDQTQMALAETQELYRISALLNAAETPKDVTEAIIGPLAGEKPSVARLWLVSVDDHLKQWLELANSWSAVNDGYERPPGFRIPISNFPFVDKMLNDERETTLVSSFSEDPRTKNDPELLAVLADIGMNSVAFLPLSIGTRLVGLFIIAWQEKHSFSDGDMRRLTAIAAQIGTSVDSLRSFEETKLRAIQLEALTDVESALSFASNENEILQSIGHAFPSSRVALHYIDIDENEAPFRFQTVASYEDGIFLEPEYLSQTLDITAFPAVEVWLHQPNQVTSIPDILQDDRTNDYTKEFARSMGYLATSVLPLRSGRLWQGVLTVSWKNPHRLTPLESFLLSELREPLGAIVASNRSRAAEEAARKESEQLYQVSRALNQAASQLSEIVNVISGFGESVGLSDSTLLMAVSGQRGRVTNLQVAAIKYHDESEATLTEGQLLGMASAEQVITFTDPVFIRSAQNQTDPTLTIGTKRLLEKIKARSALILPLLAGEQPIGFLVLSSPKTTDLSDEDRRLFNSISPQIAVAVQNSQLLAATQRKAEREEVLRQITEKVRNTSDVESVMRTAVTEIGRILNRKTFLYLKDTTDDTGEYQRPEQNNG